MEISNEIKILFIAASVMLAANLLAMLLFVLYAKLPAGSFKYLIQGIIFELDNFADSMENVDKRKAAIQQVNDVLGWRKIIIPSALIGWLIDTEVAAIRKMQMNLPEGDNLNDK